jgi:hypothetical protein
MSIQCRITHLNTCTRSACQNNPGDVFADRNGIDFHCDHVLLGNVNTAHVGANLLQHGISVEKLTPASRTYSSISMKIRKDISCAEFGENFVDGAVRLADH